MDGYNRNVLTKNNKEQKRAAKNQRIASKRPLKNFLWWLLGFFSSFLVFAGSVAICIGVLPASTFFGNDGKYIDKSISNSSLLQIALNYQSYQVKDFPIIEELFKSLLASSGIDKFFEIDYEKLNGISFNDINFQYIYENCIDITATIDNLGMASALGDFANLKIMTENTIVEETVDASSTDFNPKLYYYEDDNGKLKRAYGDDKILVSGAEGKQLYYPALIKVPLDEMIEILPARLGQSQVVDLLGIFTEVTSDSLISKLFGATSIKDMGSFDPEKIKLIDILPDGIDEKLFNILCDASSVDGAEPLTKETITIGDLSSMDTDKIHITAFIEENESNKDFFEIIKSATGKEDASLITIGDFQTFNINNVKLSTLIDESNPENETFINLLEQITETPFAELTINHIRDGLSFDNVKLTTFIPNDSANADLYAVLMDALGTSEVDEITLGNLKGISFDNVRLISIIPDDESSEKLYDILTQCYVCSKNELTIGKLKTGISFDNVKLASIISPTDETTGETTMLYNILCQSLGIDDPNEIKVSDLSSGINTDNIKLTTVMPQNEENEKLYKILLEQSGRENYDDILISDLKNGINFDNIKLNTVISSSENEVINALLKDDEVTLGNLGEKINNLNVYDLYGNRCFTTIEAEALDDVKTDKYKRVENTAGTGKYSYVYDTNGEYYISKEAGFMLLLAFNVTDVNTTNGRANKYEPSETTYAEFTQGDTMSNVFQSATVYQLIAAGIINDNSYSDALKAKRLEEILQTINALPSI